MNGYAATYKLQQIETASQEQILIMLFEGAIRFLNIAKIGNEEKNISKFHNHVVKAQRIIFELMTSLDLEVGGEVAFNLYRLYEYLHYQLIQADLKKDSAMVDEVLWHLKSLKTTWEEAIEISRKESIGEVKSATNAYSA